MRDESAARSAVLIVEDDVLTLMVAADTLRTRGIVVIEAETADAGADILKHAAQYIAVVFSDIETPGELNGLGLAQTITSQWPAIPIVLTSGRVSPDLTTFPSTVQFIPKPYEAERVCGLISEMVKIGRSTD